MTAGCLRDQPLTPFFFWLCTAKLLQALSLRRRLLIDCCKALDDSRHCPSVRPAFCPSGNMDDGCGQHVMFIELSNGRGYHVLFNELLGNFL